MHLPTSSATTPAITAITTVTTTVTAVVITTAITAAECPLPYKDYPGSLGTLFLGIVGSVIATHIADGRAAKAAILCWIFISTVWEILRMKVAWKIGALKKKWERRKRRDRQGSHGGLELAEAAQPQPEEGSGA
ncbi:uncharacterized protein K441DRAFT_162480 [Cenococcum geophilum 1.58]|uniref:uncharacterized protein n=1 Tax=Cenococcum geophilum 1.58 TaxID=794803 RepID=UPI00358FDEF5|nr:hypothetical protein K441DRAFT_162480 [Cenococcum geophilum 1.58]